MVLRIGPILAIHRSETVGSQPIAPALTVAASRVGLRDGCAVTEGALLLIDLHHVPGCRRTAFSALPAVEVMPWEGLLW